MRSLLPGLREAAVAIIREDAQKWEGVYEVRRSKGKYEEMGCDLERKLGQNWPKQQSITSMVDNSSVLSGH